MDPKTGDILAMACYPDYDLNTPYTPNATLAKTYNSHSTEEKGEVSFTDTKVGALPETGGIGTTIFTVGGCAIMVAAAALFFMNKKKHEK